MALIARSLLNIALDAPAHQQSLAPTRAAAPLTTGEDTTPGAGGQTEGPLEPQRQVGRLNSIS